MPFKANAARRHRIPKQRYRVTSWAQYDASLRQRGSLTVWFTGEAIATWRAEPRTTRGGQAHYSALAIRTALTLRAVFRLALRQTEGLIGSILQLLGLDLAVPDHSTLSRRAETSGGAKALFELHRTCSPAGRQHRPAIGWTRRVADREAWQPKTPALAKAAHRRLLAADEHKTDAEIAASLHVRADTGA